MAEGKARILRVLEALLEYPDPTSPADIGNSIGETPLNVGHDLYELGKRGLAEKPNKKKPMWLITDKGRETLENPPANWGRTLTEDTQAETSEGNLLRKPPDITLPSRSDSFKEIGEHLGIGTRGDIKLDAVIYYLQRTADMEDLDAVWNALTEMGVVSDVKKRWIKLYSQTFSGKKVSEELSKKLETEPEEKISTRAEKTEGPPIAKRFSVVNGQIIPDSESELTFSMALQKAASEGGASSGQASEVAETFAKMSQDTLNTILPLLTKEPPAPDTAMVQLLQQRVEQLADDKHKAEMDSLRVEMRSGQRSPEADQQIQTLSQQITEMKESLHNRELERIQEQNQNLIAGLVGEINKLKELIATRVEGKQAESKIGLMSKTLDVLAEEAKGARQDIKTMAPSFLGRSNPPKSKTQTEKAGFGAGLDKGIEKAKAAGALEDALFFRGQSDT